MYDEFSPEEFALDDEESPDLDEEMDDEEDEDLPEVPDDEEDM